MFPPPTTSHGLPPAAAHDEQCRQRSVASPSATRLSSRAGPGSPPRSFLVEGEDPVHKASHDVARQGPTCATALPSAMGAPLRSARAGLLSAGPHRRHAYLHDPDLTAAGSLDRGGIPPPILRREATTPRQPRIAQIRDRWCPGRRSRASSACTRTRPSRCPLAAALNARRSAGDSSTVAPRRGV